MAEVGDITLYRVVIRHPEEDHASHAPAAVGGTFDTAEDAEDFITRAEEVDLDDEISRLDLSLPIEERVRNRDEDTLAEALSLGYESEVQVLRVTEVTEDDGGGTVASAHEWAEAE